MAFQLEENLPVLSVAVKGHTPNDCRILLDGRDIGGALSKLVITLEAGNINKAELTLMVNLETDIEVETEVNGLS